MATSSTTTRKPTKIDRYNELLALDAVKANADLVAFINHEVELLTKKNSAERKPTATQTENAQLADAILVHLATVQAPGLTVSEIIKAVPACNGLSTQRISPIVSKMESEGLLTNSKVKRKSYYAAVVTA